jgi:acyl carrier protein
MVTVQSSELFRDVVEVVSCALAIHVPRAELRPETSLLELGLDSLTAVDLTVALEEALGITEFPIQDWADSEASREEPRFTLGALVATCEELIEAQSSRAIP